MSDFPPEKIGPVLIQAVVHKLHEAGLKPAHVSIVYDGMETDVHYAQGAHHWPLGHTAAQQLLLATALRDITETDDPATNGLYVRFWPDGTVFVAPATLTQGDEGDDAPNV